jgi:threonine/homoserine/homoserine lactone efflux protein
MDLISLSAATIAGFALTSFLIELTPGPNMAWLAIATVTTGRGNGFAAVAGIGLGLLGVGLAAALGLAALLTAFPALSQALRWGGVGYLLWLAYDGWISADDPPDTSLTTHARAVYFRRGLITNLLNPKAAVFYLAILPPFLPTGAGLPETLTLSLVYVAVATAVHAGIVALSAAAAPLLTNDAKRRTTARVLSALLALVALWFAWKTRG